MLVYRNDNEVVDAPSAWRVLVGRVDALSATAAHDEITSILIELGELESAIADRLFPARDSLHPLSEALRASSLAAGRLFIASWRSTSDRGAALADFRRRLEQVPEESIPRQADRRISEGYAYYALHPETYSVAAERFADTIGPASAVCVGMRSIGTSLSAVVGATLAARGIPVRLFSVRPRGHPFERELHLDENLQSVLRAPATAAHYLVIDEGPGLSGSSFAAAVGALRLLGVPTQRIALFPSWDADGSSFRSAQARECWRHHTRWVISAADAGVGIDTVVDDDGAIDWSRGAWRHTLIGPRAEWPGVHPQHERVKRLLPNRREIVRFAGLGRYGTQKHTRATILAAAGFGPVPGAPRAGYLRLPYVSGTPLSAPTAESIDFIGRYCAFVARYCPADRGTDLDAIQEMIETNCREADPSLTVPSLASFESVVADAQPAALDARMLVHEFISTSAGLVKTDALDHAIDHFFPGPQDIAWDLAAAETEFGFDAAGSAALLDTFSRASGDGAVRGRMPFFRLAYAAFQLGYATMAWQSLGDSPDGQRFRRRRDGFLVRVRALTAG